MPDYVKNTPILNESFRQFGFPFIGAHWIPHFTIASLKKDMDHPLIKEFSDLSINYTNKIDKISYWQVINGDHKLLKKDRLS